MTKKNGTFDASIKLYYDVFSLQKDVARKPMEIVLRLSRVRHSYWGYTPTHVAFAKAQFLPIL